ncbi:MAG: D-alanine--D-alanine ligase [Thiohalophilus sp.]|uniref:ATP-grasp domain-containing protein n=1 Tax=Thiohalophilus sp. TaxID=3028392 RepID=UPI0028703A45|nr:D-alanine--D-alanine ligase [Thiohalophilus sp.]MDR9437297.1 D-alanine--D-alanine ligase [Thiohalophilus sp.]
MSSNIFVVGLDDFNLAQLQSLRHANEYQFHSLLSYQAVKRPVREPIEHLLQQAYTKLDSFEGSIDAIVGYWDFPVSTILPIIRRRYNLPGPSLEAVLKCEHKYWSRCLQIEVAPELVPEFQLVNPFDPDAEDKIEIAYPFWLKPIKAASSHLGFKINNRKTLTESLAIIRDKIHRFAGPFNDILDQAAVPSHISPFDGNYCIAEGIISKGGQCTLEGYVHKGEVTVYGVVDSIRSGKQHSSFSRYQYPSNLPGRVKQRMIQAIRKVILYFGYNDSPFNAEFYWSKKDNKLYLLEINTRISKSHCPLFKMVDGEYHHAVMVDVALGNNPGFPYREGNHKVAAKFMVRHFRDGYVKTVPTRSQIDQVKQWFPDTEIQLHIEPGMWLRDLSDQDSYSYEIATLFMGANNQKQLLANYQAALDGLSFDIRDTE